MGPGLPTAARPPGDRSRVCYAPRGSPLKLRPRRSQAPPPTSLKLRPRRIPSSAPRCLSSSAPRRFPAEVCGSEGQTPVCGVHVASYTLPQLRHLEMRLNPQRPLDRAGFRRSRVLLCRRIRRHSGLARGRGAGPAPRPSARSGRSLEVGRRRISPHVSRPRVSKAGAGDASDEASRARRKARRSGPRSALASPGGLFRLPRACALIQERKPREETRQIRASQPRRRFGSRCCSPAPAPASPRRHPGHASHRRTPSLTAVCFDGA